MVILPHRRLHFRGGPTYGPPLVYDPDTQLMNWYSGAGFTGESANVSLSTFDAVSVPLVYGITIISNDPVQITSITNLSSYINLSDLIITGQLLTSLDAHGLPNLSSLSINVSGLTVLTILSSAENPLATINLSDCPSLPGLTIMGGDPNGAVETLDVHGCSSMEYLTCEFQSISSIDVTGCPAMTALHCGYNSIPSIDLTGNTGLLDLQCFQNLLTTLDPSPCPALTSLQCTGNPGLTSLDCSGNSALSDLQCSECAITGLNLSGTALVSLYFFTNPISTISISGLTALLYVFGQGCALDQTSVDNLLIELDTNGMSGGYVDLSGGTNATPISSAAAVVSLIGKGWTVTTN